jgi:hypothetical protein
VSTTDTPGPDLVTEADVAGLNRAAIARTTAFARLAGNAGIVIGAVAALGWAWLTVRTQGEIGDANVTFGGGPPSDADLSDRIDLVVTSLPLLIYAALVAGVGMTLRLGADYAEARTGGSLTGLDVGDELLEGDDEDGDDGMSGEGGS